MEVPAMLARRLGATYVISVYLPTLESDEAPSNVFQVVNRCFQIMQRRVEKDWRVASDLVIAPDVRGIPWDGFDRGMEMVKAGERAAEVALTPGFSRRLDRWKHLGDGQSASSPAALRAESPARSG